LQPGAVLALDEGRAAGVAAAGVLADLTGDEFTAFGGDGVDAGGDLALEAAFAGQQRRGVVLAVVAYGAEADDGHRGADRHGLVPVVLGGQQGDDGHADRLLVDLDEAEVEGVGPAVRDAGVRVDPVALDRRLLLRRQRGPEVHADLRDVRARREAVRGRQDDARRDQGARAQVAEGRVLRVHGEHRDHARPAEGVDRLAADDRLR
jgi:hypothetical protein